MIIGKQSIISWLLDKNSDVHTDDLGVPVLDNKEHVMYLFNGLDFLASIKEHNPNWGLPELLMPSFGEVMKKSAKSFFGIDHELFQQFYKDNVCGILISRDIGTIVYGFGENTLYVWVFNVKGYNSQLCLYFYVESTPENHRKIYTNPTLLQNRQLFNVDAPQTQDIYEIITNKLMIYLAVKKYVRVETVVVPPSSTVKMENVIHDYKGKDKIRNESGQEVIVMDSRWFRKIVNDNDIFVRGFFRFQNKKNKNGEWYKELIFVDAFVRHGYHRMARIEEEDAKKKDRKE